MTHPHATCTQYLFTWYSFARSAVTLLEAQSQANLQMCTCRSVYMYIHAYARLYICSSYSNDLEGAKVPG